MNRTAIVLFLAATAVSVFVPSIVESYLPDQWPESHTSATSADGDRSDVASTRLGQACQGDWIGTFGGDDVGMVGGYMADNQLVFDRIESCVECAEGPHLRTTDTHLTVAAATDGRLETVESRVSVILRGRLNRRGCTAGGGWENTSNGARGWWQMHRSCWSRWRGAFSGDDMGVTGAFVGASQLIFDTIVSCAEDCPPGFTSLAHLRADHPRHVELEIRPPGRLVTVRTELSVEMEGSVDFAVCAATGTWTNTQNQAAGAWHLQALTPRLLVVGDSWAGDMVWDESFEREFISNGLTGIAAGGVLTGIGGTFAVDWNSDGYKALITRELLGAPSIDAVHLSAGGNDLLFSGPIQGRQLNDEELMEVVDQVSTNVRGVVEHIHQLRPGARVTHASYDYLPRSDYFPEGGLVREFEALSSGALRLAGETDGLYFLNNLGLLHYVFGVEDEFGPGETPAPGGPPDYHPLLGGDPSIPGDPARWYNAIHPTLGEGGGYAAIARNAVEDFYEGWFGGAPDTH